MVGLFDAMLRHYHIHPAPETLTETEWIQHIGYMQIIRKAEAKNNA